MAESKSDRGRAVARREGMGTGVAVDAGALSKLDRQVLRHLRGPLSEAEIAAELSQSVLAIHRSVRRLIRQIGNAPALLQTYGDGE